MKPNFVAAKREYESSDDLILDDDSDGQRVVSRQTSSTNDEKCFTKSGFFGLVAAILILVAGNVAAAFVAVVSHRRAKFLRQKQAGNGLSPVFVPIVGGIRDRPTSIVGGLRDQLIRLRYPTERTNPETAPGDAGSQKFSVAQPEINLSRLFRIARGA